MPKYEITRQIKLNYQVEAETESDALEAPVPRGGGVVMSTIKERARDLDKPKSGVKVISDRVLRQGRVFTRTYKGHSFTATVLPGARIRLESDGIAGSVYKTLHQAATAATEIADGRKHSVNCWAFWHESTLTPKPATAVEPTPEPMPAKVKKAAAKKGSKKAMS